MLPEQDMFIENLHRKCFKKLTIYAASKLRDSDRAQDVVQCRGTGYLRKAG